MKNVPDFSEQLASYLYKLEDVQHIRSGESLFQHRPSLYGMLLFKEAEGDIRIDGRRYPAQRHKVFLLPPRADVKLCLHPDHPTDYYYLRFHILKETDSHQFAPAEWNRPHDVPVTYFYFLADKVDEIKRKWRSGNGWDAMKANILFQEMLCVLWNDAVREQKRDVSRAIELTLDYIKRNYPRHITREKLADMAVMSPDYYSRAFKKKTGKSPTEYLTDIRINEAKKLLLQSHDSFRSIAKRVGFSDEFYFSRKFKAVTGHSPTSYVKKMKGSDKIASLKHLPTGHLLALGIEPYAAVINHVYPVTKRLRNTIAVGDEQPDLEKLMDARPDVIVTREFRDIKNSQREKLFDQIAPTIRLPFFQDWRVQLKTIARVVGREKEANDWLERYEQKAETVRKQIKRQVGEETVLIVGIGVGKMCVYGQRNLGAVLYGDLKLAVPPGVADVAHYKEISLQDLFAFEADRMILTSFKHDGTRQMDNAIRREVEALLKNERLYTLKAVQNRAVYGLLDNRHLYTCYTSYSHDLLLDKMYELFLADSSK